MSLEFAAIILPMGVLSRQCRICCQVRGTNGGVVFFFDARTLIQSTIEPALKPTFPPALVDGPFGMV